MKKNNIVPMPANEAKRRQIQQKLSMQKSLEGGDKQEDFFTRRKDAFVSKMAQMGLESQYVNEFLEKKGLHTEDPELLLDYI